MFWVGQSWTVQDFIMLLRMVCKLKLMNYFWNFLFNMIIIFNLFHLIWPLVIETTESRTVDMGGLLYAPPIKWNLFTWGFFLLLLFFYISQAMCPIVEGLKEAHLTKQHEHPIIITLMNYKRISVFFPDTTNLIIPDNITTL